MIKLFRVLSTVIFITCTLYNYGHPRLRRQPQQKVFSRSYMLPRPAYDHRPMMQSQWAHIIHQECATRGFQIFPYFQKSINQDKTIQYFLPKCRTELLVVGDNVQDQSKVCSRDVRAEWVGLPSDFNGILKIQPEQQQVGFSLALHQHLGDFFDISLLKNWYIGVHIPLLLLIIN